jgi:glycosyltransferase involved in cell wall biosynthesis
MSKYRILLVVRHPVGGIRTFLRYVCRTLSSDKYQFSLVAPDVPETRVLLDDLRHLNIDYLRADPRVSNRQLFQIATRLILKGHFDLIYSHGYTSAASAVLGASLTRTPHAVTCHDVFTERQFMGFGGMVRKALLGIILSLVDRVHCVSQDARANLLNFLPILRFWQGKVVAIPNGIDVQRFLKSGARDLRQELGLSSDGFLIGFLGRFMSQKGFRYLVDALAAMVQTKGLPRRSILLTFGDDGFIREEREAVTKRGLRKVVHFLPFVPDIASTLKGLDVVVMPSLWEACPLLPMEAMVAGVPVIGTNCIGLREVLQDTPAKVVPTRDGVALAEALIHEMKDPTTSAARAFVAEAADRFEVKRQVVELEKLMLSLLKR